MCTAVIAGIGMLFSAMGTISQMNAADAAAESQIAQYKYQEQINEQNAAMASKQADDAKRRGFQEESDFRLKASQALSTQKSLLAGQGSDVSSGDAQNIIGNTIRTTETDAATIRYNSGLEAYDLLSQGQNFLNTAQQQNFAAKNTDKMASINKTTTLLTGIGSLGSQFMQYKKSGVF